LGLLSGIWTHEGKGVEPEAAATGLRLLWATIRRELWELFVLNWLILLSCVPVVTIPAAHAAAAHIALRMLDDDPRYLWRDYWRAFGAVLVRATLFGLGAGALVLGAAWVTFVYAQLALRTLVYVGPFVVAACVTVLAACWAMTGLVLIGQEVSVRNGLVRRATLATLSRPRPLLAGLAAIVALWASLFVFYPVSVFLPATVGFSLGTLIAAFAARPGAEKCGALPATQQWRKTE